MVLVEHIQCTSWDNVTYTLACWGNGTCEQATCSKKVGTILLKLIHVLQRNIDHCKKLKLSVSIANKYMQTHGERMTVCHCHWVASEHQ